ncbi:MAG: site-specific recombinase resolvase [Novosphingobium sp.]|nr:site-specific recombinase resolvase [Novosphingobium sp.]
MNADQQLEIRVPITLRRRGGRKLIITPDAEKGRAGTLRDGQDGTLVKAIARGFRWRKLLEQSVYENVDEIAAKEKIDRSYVSRLLRMTLLAPDIVERVLAGRQPRGINLQMLKRPIPDCWEEQRDLLLKL